MMKSCAICDFSSDGVNVVWRPFCTFCHETSSCCNSKVHCPICPRLHRFDKSSGRNTSTCQYSVIAPPTDNRKSASCDKDHPIDMKFTWCGLHMISSNMTYNKCVLYRHIVDKGSEISLVQDVSNGHEKFKAVSTSPLWGHGGCHSPQRAWPLRRP